MKIRFTIGNVIAIGTTASGLIAQFAPAIATAHPKLGAQLLSVGATIALVTKGLASWNHDQIPDDKKVSVGPVVIEKTGPFKPEPTPPFSASF